MILSVRLRRSKRKAKILFIVDHKSWPDKLVIQQLLKYQLTMIEEHYDNEEGFLPPVFTIIFYHGQKGWNLPFSLHEDWISRGIFSKAGFRSKFLNIL